MEINEGYKGKTADVTFKHILRRLVEMYLRHILYLTMVLGNAKTVVFTHKGSASEENYGHS